MDIIHQTRQFWRRLTGAKSFAPLAKSFDRPMRDDLFLLGAGGGMDTDSVLGTATPQALDKAAEEHPVVFAALDVIGAAGCAMPFRVGHEVDDEWMSIDAGQAGWDMQELVDVPNPFMSRKQLLKMVFKSMRVHNLAYVQKIREGGRVKALYWWPTSFVVEIRPKRDEMRPVLGYRVHGQEGTVDPEDMIRICDPSTGHTWEPARPLRACWGDIRLDQERLLYQAEMLMNTPVPGVAINVGSRGMTPTQQTDAQNEARRIFGRGGNNRGNAFMYGGDGGGATMLEGLTDLDWPGLAAQCETRICSVLQVPPIMIHTRAGLERSTMSNYGEAKESLYNECILPLASLIADAFTLSLLEQEGYPGLEFRFDSDDISALQDDMDALATRMVALEGAGHISVDESRTALGYDPAGGEFAELRKRPDPAAMFQEGFGAQDGGDDSDDDKQPPKLEAVADGD